MAAAVGAGWSKEETVELVSFAEPYPVDVGHGYMMAYIQTLNPGSLYNKLIPTRPSPSLPA